MIKNKDSQRTLRLQLYKKLLNYTCGHPDCESGTDIEAHHIRPLYKCGKDKFWNIISLCWQCHRTKKLHSKSEEKMTELYVYKCMHEMRSAGFVFDEEEPEFLDNLKRYKREHKLLSAEEDLIIDNLDRLISN